MSGGWHPAINTSHLHEFVLQAPFKMETSLHASLRPRGGFPSFHRSDGRIFPDTVPVHQSSRKLLRFLSGGGGGGSLSVQGPALRTVDYPSGFHSGVCSHLCVGSLPRDSSSQVPGRLADHRLVGVGGQKNVQDLLSLCHSLGIVLNEEKSDLVPSQTANYLGMTIDTGAARIFPSLARVEKFLSVVETFCALYAPPAQLWRVFSGHLASLERLVPHCRLRTRSLQWHLKTHWSPKLDPPSLPVLLSREVREDVS